ncbi:MAG TPA: Stp1/IreP family PP2C-type Ser/Thr phosphatase, partial [Acidimicrobiales bacterium]|nr:Stp1/IreP family PP2C-type Ser/Thr phosphatase [Acidimicrobiales bacterium]
MLRSGSATDVGRVRPINQDMPLERPNLYAVADGMGGHVGGEVAARVAVETLEQAFEREPTVAGLRDAFSEANAAVWHESQINADLRGMGTTLTAVALVGGEAGQDVLALANVGDSRAYVYSDGRLLQVTADHSLAEERMRHGEMTEAEAAVHPQRHILTRALGVSSEVQTDMWELQLRTGDRVLLCSDGLSNEVGMDEMAGILGEIRDPEEAAGRLVDAANEHGGSDNITVIIVDVQVGEDGPDGASKITPIGASTAAITIASASAATAAVAAVPNGAAPAPEGPGPGGNDAPEHSDATQALPLSGMTPLPAFSD